MAADILISFEEDSLTTVEIYDASTDITLSDINAVRVMFGAYNNTISGQSTSSLLAWTEYSADQAMTINGASYAEGDSIYLSEDTDIGTDTATATGFYGEMQTWVPLDGDSMSFTPSQTGLSGDDTYFPDTVFTVVYELYSTQYTSADVSIPANTYIVSGDSVVVSGATYQPGEVFTKTGTFTFTGSGVIYAFEDSAESYFATTADAFATMQSYITSISSNLNPNIENVTKLYKIIANYEAIDFGAEQNYGFSLSYMQSLLDEIQTYYAVTQ